MMVGHIAAGALRDTLHTEYGQVSPWFSLIKTAYIASCVMGMAKETEKLAKIAMEGLLSQSRFAPLTMLAQTTRLRLWKPRATRPMILLIKTRHRQKRRACEANVGQKGEK